jgi:hypothetical protein
MTTSKTGDEQRTRERVAAVAHHRQVVELLLGDAVRFVVAGLRPSWGTALGTLPLLSPEQADFFYRGLRSRRPGNWSAG